MRTADTPNSGVKGKWQQKFLSSHFKDFKTIDRSLLQNFLSCDISRDALFHDIF